MIGLFNEGRVLGDPKSSSPAVPEGACGIPLSPATLRSIIRHPFLAEQDRWRCSRGLRNCRSRCQGAFGIRVSPCILNSQMVVCTVCSNKQSSSPGSFQCPAPLMLRPGPFICAAEPLKPFSRSGGSRGRGPRVTGPRHLRPQGARDKDLYQGLMTGLCRVLQGFTA